MNTGLFRPHPNPDLRTLSLGAGVQSTALARLAAAGIVMPMPDIAICSDTKWEGAGFYKSLGELKSSGALPFDVLVVSRSGSGGIRADLVDRISGRRSRFAAIPFFSVDAAGNKAMGRRHCTREYKIEVVQAAIREFLGVKSLRGKVVEVWKGISLDEIARCSPSKQKWEFSRWPLIEQRMTRADCVKWLEKNGHPVPEKSSCVGCPYHSDAHWREMKENRPAEFEDACEIDDMIRDGSRWGFNNKQYMHRSCVPLRDVDFSADDANGQLNLFINECEGMCGL